jgi:GTP-binding protein YchF
MHVARPAAAASRGAQRRWLSTSDAVAPFYPQLYFKQTTNLAAGIVGLPNVGKSALFNALTNRSIPSENFPFCTIDPNEAVVEVADPRLAVLSDISGSHKIIPAHMRLVDIAGLVEGASKGEGLGNKFLANIREVDAILHVVRCFEDGDVVRAGSTAPVADIDLINTELVLADLQMVSKSMDGLVRKAKSCKASAAALGPLEVVQAHLNENCLASTAPLGLEEWEKIKHFALLTAKPVLYLANVGEGDVDGSGAAAKAKHAQEVAEHAAAMGERSMPLCVWLEAEAVMMAEEDPDGVADFLEMSGMDESSIPSVLTTTFDLLDLNCFHTTGVEETRAWTIRKGSTAQEAAGKIHTDIAKSFIKAEVVSHDDLVEAGSWTAAKTAGTCNAEGKEYIMKDGDVVSFLHGA